jgi:hypothetical protein
VVRALAERGAQKAEHAESDVSPGSLYATGLIAAGGVFGLLAMVLTVLGDIDLNRFLPYNIAKVVQAMIYPFLGHGGKWLGEHTKDSYFGDVTQSSLLGVIMFLLLASSLYYSARKKLD